MPHPVRRRGRGRRPAIADDEDAFAAAERDSDGEYDAPPEDEELYQEGGGGEFPVEFWAKQEGLEMQYDNDNKIYFDLTAEESQFDFITRITGTVVEARGKFRGTEITLNILSRFIPMQPITDLMPMQHTLLLVQKIPQS